LGAKCNRQASPYQRYDDGVPGFIDGYALGDLAIWNIFEDRLDELNGKFVERHCRLDVEMFEAREIPNGERSLICVIYVKE
jgi:hypothetical protein